MRPPLAIALTLAGLVAGANLARAADLSRAVTEPGSSYEIEPQRPAGQILIYDFEPGVVLRAWWLPPWRHRHYFPFGIARPAALHPARPLPQQAEPFERSWSTCSTCDGEGPPAAVPTFDQPPPTDDSSGFRRPAGRRFMRGPGSPHRAPTRRHSTH